MPRDRRRIQRGQSVERTFLKFAHNSNPPGVCAMTRSVEQVTSLDRRRFVALSGMSLLGSRIAASEPTVPATAKPIKACIVLFHYGGPSSHETWDPKPNAPREIRGEFNTIETSVPGLRIGEHLPYSARIMDRAAILPAMHHPMRNHNSAAVEALCGRTPLKGDLELLSNDPTSDFPCYGSALSFLLGKPGPMPVHVALPHVMYNVVMLPGQTPGFLGPAHAPLQVDKDPTSEDFGVRELQLPSDISRGRLAERSSLLHQLQGSLPPAERRGPGLAVEAFYSRAFSLLSSDRVQSAFDLSRESDRTRDRYGRTVLGQSALLARRLVEHGVKFVNVHDKFVNGLNNWDTHVRNFARLKDELLPPSDQAFAALIEDLEDRGLLDSTLVVWMGEFGRTPKINGDGGRDHWPDCYSIVLAGGGVKGGARHGASDRIGAYPDSGGVSTGDLASTLFWRFGFDPTREIKDPAGRPYRLTEGEPLRSLFG